MFYNACSKDFYIDHYNIRFLRVEGGENVRYGMFMALALYSLWRTRIAVWRAEVRPKSARLFLELVLQIKNVLERSETPPSGSIR